MPRTISLGIDAIAAGGDGVGRTDGLVVFVPRSAPGDLITATIAGKGGGRFARGTLRSILRPSPDRVDPPCQHYTRDRCGGCQIQHIAYGAQLSAKSRIVADAVTRIGKRAVETPAVAPSEKKWRYRTKLTLALRRRGANWIGGLHAYDDPSRVFALADCPITDRRVVTAWREVLAASRFFPDATALRGSIRWTDDGPTFVLVGGVRWPGHAEFFAAAPSLAALYWEPRDSPRRSLADRRVAASPAASFAQVNPAVARNVRKYVCKLVVDFSPEYVIDAYSGAGDLAAAIAEQGITVTAIELDPDAARWAEQRLAPPSRSIAGRVEDVLPRLAPAELVVANPPRGGLDADVTAMISEEAATRALVYVSCDPTTLARDLCRLPEFDISSIRAFDMFPQTAHVETVCLLLRREVPAR